jgi:hypothetical protein
MVTTHTMYQLQEGIGPQGEPVRTNCFEILIPSLGDITLYCNKFTLPSLTITALEIRHFNGIAKIAGDFTIGNPSIEVRDVITPQTNVQMLMWRNQVVDVMNGIIGFATDYKKRGLAFRYDSKGNRVRTYELFGLWPLSYTESEMDYTGDKSGNLITCELAVDNVAIY